MDNVRNFEKLIYSVSREEVVKTQNGFMRSARRRFDFSQQMG